MGLFSKNKASAKTEKNNIIDVHTHILPGIDDGSKNMEQSLRMLEIAEQEGIHTIIATPHNMPGKGKASPAHVRKLIEELQNEAEQNGLDITILPGCELFYREDALELLEQERILGMNDSDCILVEFDVVAQKQYIANALRNILSFGYTPVVAHVERYGALMEKGFAAIKDFRSMGCFIQVNADTVAGKCGSTLRKYAKQMLKEQLVDFIGTDAHSDRSRAPRMQECILTLYKWCPADYVEALVHGNAEEYLDI